MLSMVVVSVNSVHTANDVRSCPVDRALQICVGGNDCFAPFTRTRLHRHRVRSFVLTVGDPTRLIESSVASTKVEFLISATDLSSASRALLRVRGPDQWSITI